MAALAALAAFLAVGLNEVSAKGSLPPSTQEIMLQTTTLLSKEEIMAHTTIESATQLVLNMQHTHPRAGELIALIKDKLGVKHRKAALRAAKAKVIAHEDSDAATAQTATEMLNEMMEETELKLGIEQETCRSFNRTRLVMLQATRNSVATFNAAANRARGLVLLATSEIRRITQEIQETQGALREHTLQCQQQIRGLKDELAIVMADITVMETILEMTACETDDASAFLQLSSKATMTSVVNCAHCNRGRGFMMLRSSKIQPLLNQLRSAAARTYLQQHLKAVFLQASRKSTPVALAQVDITEMNGLARGMAKARQSKEDPSSNETIVLSDNQTNISAVPEEPTPVDCVYTNKCTLSPANCQALQDRFLLIQAGIMDKKAELTLELGNLEDSCEHQTNLYKEQLESLDTRLGEQQSSLATSTSEQNEAESGSNQKAAEFDSLNTEYHSTMTSCCDNENSLLSEKCALAKIRGELAKLSDESSYVIDCEVSDWGYEACDKTCGGGQRKMTRSVLVHPKGGMACPPLTQFESCNEELCPVDCVVYDWEGWSGCSAECDGGTMTRNRRVKVEPANGGEECGALSDTTSCNVEACSKDCDLADWTEWTDCSKYCDIGHSRRSRSIEAPAVGTGTCPLPESEQRLQFKPCNEMTCESLLPTPGSLVTCKAKVDIMVLLDGSGSLGQFGWEKSKQFTKYFIQSLKGSDEFVKVALQVFSGPKTWTDYYACIGATPGVEVDMEEQCSIRWVEHFTNETANLANMVQNVEWPAASTLTSVALAQAEAELIHGREDAASLVVVITDGFPISQARTLEAAEKLKAKANVLWVPVGSAAPIEMIQKLASLPKEEHVVPINTFSDMTTSTMINKVLANACPTLEIPGYNP